ncbi:SixA phosphatase family protein [Shewanella saliphila]|nr:phosphoglycerate mutase family protein [Shewanella saliphila]MCL1100162.1 histidine phosphatase family protein [Shewanella saliphila]
MTLNKTQIMTNLLSSLIIFCCSVFSVHATNIDNINTATAAGAKVFYLVRHAEKNQGADPSLTEQGKLSAKRLANVLSSTLLTKVYTTDYKRTRETAFAVAEEQHLELSLYDPSNLNKAAEVLLNQQGHILVVGHSNTTTALAELLGADKQPVINDANEFDRLYIVTVDKNNREVSTVLLRY